MRDGQDGVHIERNSGKECGQFIGKRACFKRVEPTAAAQLETGAMMQTGAAVVSMM